ncbi:MAG TPA: hypothetical protein VFI41_05130 [Gemmatimonadales bacterium]|nr:hypothetical protein [Gemmatimonadales bacterium]
MTPGFTGPFKGQPQPGTLFDKRALDQLPGNMNLTRQRPGPRGYSPERLAAVRDNFKAHVEVSTNMNEAGHLYGPSHYDRNADPGGDIANRARSRMLDTLARSTIPTNEYDEKADYAPRVASRRGAPKPEKYTSDPLVGLEHIRTYPKSPHDALTVAGEYMSHGDQVRPGQPSLRPMDMPDVPKTRKATIGLYPTARDDWGHALGTQAAVKGDDPRAEQTFLHELGHHDSYVEASESSRYETKAQQAAEEGRADRFAVQHFRQDPRSKEKGYDPRENTYMARGMHGFSGHSAYYEKALPAEMHPPVKTNPNLRTEQFEQPELPPAKGRHAVGDIFVERGVVNPRGWTR